MSLPTVADLVETRRGWHRVAEHVLAAGQFAASGTIRLRPWPGGFATAVGVGGTQLAVVGDELQLIEAGTTRHRPLTSLRDAAEFAGVSPGLHGSYEPTTPLDLDEPVRIDAGAAERLAAWFALGDEALRRFADELARPMDPVLWPEHFDLGMSVDDVNFGVSPGDDQRPEP